MRYFDHDTSASDDDKIMALRIDCGGAAVDAYWAVLEKIYRDESPLVLSENQPGTKALTHRLCVGFDQLKTWCMEMVDVGLLVEKDEWEDALGLGENDEEHVIILTSERAIDNINSYNEKRETARQNGKRGGRKPTSNQQQTKTVSKKNQGANQTQTEPLAKEKEKEKEKEINNNPFDSPSDESAMFVADALTAYNEESGQDVRELPGSCYADLQRIRENGRTIEDVRRVVRSKRRQWEGDQRMARYLRPSTIFKHFEEYINEPEEVTEREPDFSDAVRPGDDAAF